MVSTYNPNPYPYDDSGYADNRWWLDPNYIWGGMNPPPFGPAGAGEPGGGRGGGGGQQAPNTGQVVEGPIDPTVNPGQDPVFSTDVWGDRPPVQTLGYDPNYTLNQYLASLPGGGQAGGTGGDYKTYFTGDLGGGDTGGGGGGNTNTYWDFPDTGGDPKFETTAFDTTDTGGRGNTYTYFSDPSAKDYYTYFAPVPTTPPSTKPPVVPPWIGGPLDKPKTQDDWEWPPTPRPTQPGGQQQQQQKPGVGPLLAALPMLAAFQGGTTTTPAPYAHLGPHTPVAPTFKPQGRGNPIPSIGQLLAGVR